MIVRTSSLAVLLAAACPGGSSEQPEQPPVAVVEGGEDELRIIRDPELLLDAPTDPLEPPRTPQVPDGAARTAYAWQFNAPIYEAPGSKRIIGFARRGTKLPAANRAKRAKGCRVLWWKLQAGGWVCGTKGFNVGAQPTELEPALRTIPPQDAALPFEYMRIKEPGTLMYRRLPTTREEAAAAKREEIVRPVMMRTEGAMFIAVQEHVKREDGVEFLRDIRGRFVRADDCVAPVAQTIRGEMLHGPSDLPLAFVIAEEVPVWSEDGEQLGLANKFGRSKVLGVVERDGRAMVETQAGLLPREHVQVAELATRPDGVGANDQWIHVDLDRQVLVAYEGESPKMVTLVSSGKEGFETPRGLFRVEKKYTTRRMSGPDPDTGSFDIDQVPYTMFYWGSYALHGAYWHNDFGAVRSHGCTNIPPADARWLFRWANPGLEPGWHGRVRVRGPHVYMTSGDSPYPTSVLRAPNDGASK